MKPVSAETGITDHFPLAAIAGQAESAEQYIKALLRI